MSQKPYSSAYSISIAVLAILTLLSLIWYQERMFFVDPCWVSFNIINTGTFSFAEYRYGAFISQLFPLTAVYFGLSLKSILILYSFGFYAFYLSSALIIGWVWKQKWLAILLVLYFTVFVSDVYFWPNNEVHQGVTWMFLFLALYLKARSERKFTIITHIFLILFAALAISSHLIVLIPFLYLWLYLHLNKAQQSDYLKNLVLYSILLISFGIGRYWLSTSGWYDVHKLEPIQSISLKNILQSYQSGQSKSFLKLVFSNYWILFLPLALGIISLLKNKKYVHILLFLAFVSGYYSLVCLTYPDAFTRSTRFYMESEWMALSILLFTPFILEFFNIPKLKFTATAVLLIVFLIRGFFIVDAYQFFHHRFLNLKELTLSFHDKEVTKAIIFEDKERTDSLFIMSWGLPVESMMLSSVEGISPQITFKFVEQNFPAAQIQDSFYSCFEVQPLSFLNSKYFQLDSAKKYTYFQGIQNLNSPEKP